MTTAAEGAQTGASNASTPNPPPPPAAPAPGAAPSNGVAAPPPPAPGGGERASRVLGDDESPEAGGRYELSGAALEKRLQRASRASVAATLKEVAGTDDPAVVKERLAKLAKLEADQEAARQAQLSKEQKLQEERDAAREEARVAKERADAVEEASDVASADSVLKEALSATIAPKMWRHARTDLAQHLEDTFTAEELDTLSDAEREKAVKEWAEQYVKDNPEFAAKKAADPPPAERRPLTGVANPGGAGAAGGKQPAVKTTGQGALEGKTLKPGQPNSMSAAELAQWKRQNGHNW